MTPALVAALVTAGVLGVTHAVEPDHVAGIASLTGRYEDSRLSALVGACFSLGHVALVVGWLGVGYLLLHRTDYPAIFETVGRVGVAVSLGVLGTVLAFGGLRRLRYAHSHEHTHDGTRHSHAHAHLPWFGSDDGGAHADGVARPEHSHDHTLRAYLKTGVVGALFTLSPPISMITFAATLFPTAGPSVVVLAVVAYAVAITATMSVLGAGVGALFGKVSETNVRVYGGAQVLAGAVVVAMAVSMVADSLVGP
ncbi:MAG: hypothetical protein ABEJ78_09190 [Haloferacaceae archaeon]